MSYENITFAYLSRWLAEADALDLVIFLGCVNEFPATDDRTRELKSPNTRRIDVGSSSVILVSVSRGEYIEIFSFLLYLRKETGDDFSYLHVRLLCVNGLISISFVKVVNVFKFTSK